MGTHKNDGGPAFPRADQGYALTHDGMSLRDYFAAQALPQIMRSADNQSALSWPEWCAKCASASYDIADAMLAERAK